jgi:hypothetical protein
VFAQAIEDALSDLGVEVLEIPLSPNRLFELIGERRSGSSGAERGVVGGAR